MSIRRRTTLATLQEDLEAHTKQDAERFASMDKKLDTLIESRIFQRAVWWTITLIAGTGASLIGLAITVWKAVH
jgi:hypothetical protein